MATTKEYIEYVCEQLPIIGEIRYKLMFGEYMVYINNKPVMIVCNNTPYVKILPETTRIMSDAATGYPYNGAKEHYILDIENDELTNDVITVLESVTPLPKPRKKKDTK